MSASNDHQVLSLPPEILIDILEYTIRTHRESIVAVLSTCSLFNILGRGIIHQNLAFTSLFQLHCFTQTLPQRIPSSTKPYFACSPRTLTLELAGGRLWFAEQDYQVGTWDLLYKAAGNMINQLHGNTGSTTRGTQERLKLESIRLRLNSHTGDSSGAIYKALCGLDSQSFTWTGPDPPHHFSTAIVRHAVPPLFRALTTYTRLTHLKLTNISFPDYHENQRYELPTLYALQFFYLGQSTFLRAPTIAQFILKCLYPEFDFSNIEGGFSVEPSESTTGAEDRRFPSPTSAKLSCIQEIRLVDVYEGSIWENRLRMPHIVRAVEVLLGTNQMPLGEVKDAISKVVRVEVQTERIEGGDRGD
ncbi:hypothetical protein V5O48_002096 [Marasmius crinis-equi]|uniref:F-box domain-containing protein n=1 Tax=Marasmius crinis-equi TaxID=585013 RepID=A0ABR3FWL6_9AGAR